MIEASDLVKRYGRLDAVRGVSFEVGTGEIVGLLGPNGAGKTTIMKILTCYHRPSAGWARVDSHDVVGDSLGARRAVGYLPENAPVYQDVTVAEYLDFVARVRGYRPRDRRERVERAMTLCGLTAMAYRAIGHLSKGYRQRVGLAQSILHDPDTLILDEPTTGLDPNQIAEIRELVRTIGQRRTVILSTHILAEVEHLCRRVLILNEGRIAAEGTTAQLEGMVARELLTVAVTIEGTTPQGLSAAMQSLPAGAVAGSPVGSTPGRVALEITLTDRLTEGDIFRWAVETGLTIVNLQAKRLNLEEIFRSLTISEAGNA